MADTSNSRTYRDITLFSIGGTVVLGRLKNARSSARNLGIPISGGTDTWMTNKPGINSLEITGEMNVWSSSALANSIGTVVAFTSDLGGHVRSGSGLLSAQEESWAHPSAEGETFTLTVTGTPSLT